MADLDRRRHPSSWGPDGDELFYVATDALMAVPVRTTPSFEPGRPTPVVRDQGYYWMLGGALGRFYDVAPDGQRFLMIKEAPEADETRGRAEIQVVLNWDQELKARVPVP